MFLTKKKIVCVLLFTVFPIFMGCNGDESGKPENVQLGVNLIKNSSFEEWNDSIPDGWKARIIDEVSSEGELVNRVKRSSEDKKSGDYSCSFESNDSTHKWVALVQVVPVMEGNDLLVSTGDKTKNLQGISAGNPGNIYSN